MEFIKMQSAGSDRFYYDVMNHERGYLGRIYKSDPFNQWVFQPENHRITLVELTQIAAKIGELV